MLGALGSQSQCMASVGSSGCSVAPGSGRMEVHGIPAVHLDSLGAVITGIRFVVRWWYDECNSVNSV